MIVRKFPKYKPPVADLCGGKWEVEGDCAASLGYNGGGGFPTTTVEFSSIYEMADYVDTMREQGKRSGTGGDIGPHVSKRMRLGSKARVEKARSMLRRVMHEINTERPKWQASMAGAFPCVPDYLMGRPDAMQARNYDRSRTAPLNLYIDTTSSASFGPDELVLRGVAFTALTMALSAVRPVSLYFTAGLGVAPRTVMIACKLPTTPIDLAIISDVFAGGETTRAGAFGICQGAFNAGGGWEWVLTPDTPARREGWTRTMREVFKLKPDDLIIPPAHDGDRLAVDDPVEFIRQTVAAHGIQQSGARR